MKILFYIYDGKTKISSILIRLFISLRDIFLIKDDWKNLMVVFVIFIFNLSVIIGK